MTKIGDRISDERGTWVVVGIASEHGTPIVSRVREGSLAHQVIASQFPRGEVSLALHPPYPAYLADNEVAKAEKIVAKLVAAGENETEARQSIVNLFYDPKRFQAHIDRLLQEDELDN